MMMSNMQRARSNRAQAAPEFVDLCKTLYGDLIDPQIIWDDVFKASPDSADVSTHGGGPVKQVLRGTALTGAALGGYLGIKEAREGYKGMASEVGQPRRVKASRTPAGVRVPKGPKVARFSVPKAAKAIRAGAKLTPGTKGKLLVGGGLIPMDALEVGVIGSDLHSARKKKAGALVPVQKSVASEVMGGATKMKNGFLHMWNGPKAPKPQTDFLPKAAKPPKPAAPKVAPPHTAASPAAAEATSNKASAQRAQGKDIGNMLGTTSGKVMTGSLVATAGYKAKKAAGQRGAMSYVPDEMAKSAPDVEWKGTFSKFDDDKHLAFGWASVVSKGGVPVIDKQGDYIAIDDLEEAAYSYVIKSRVGGDNHTRSGPTAFKASDLVESMIFTDDKVEKMGLPHDFPRGWWVGFKVHDDNVWSEVRKGNRTGFSIHGKGIRSNQSVDEIMGYTK